MEATLDAEQAQKPITLHMHQDYVDLREHYQT